MEIDLQSGKAISAPTLIRHSPHGASVAEGPHIFKKDGFYYVSIAEGGTEKDHQQWIFRSSTGPLGPYEDPPAGVNPILHNGDSEQIQQTGHMDMVESPSGQWWAVYLAVRGGRYEKGGWSQLGRETFLSPVEWVDGWPKVNSGERVEINGSKGASLLRIEESMIERYTFEPATREWTCRSAGRAISKASGLPAGWYHLRTPMTKDWSLDDRPGSLTLYGTPYTLDIDECPAAVFRKQTAFSGTWTFNLDFGAQEGDEAGVVVWWSRRAYASLSIIGQAGGSAHLQVKWCEADSDVFSVSCLEHRLPCTELISDINLSPVNR
jgi:beta-xylosidase